MRRVLAVLIIAFTFSLAVHAATGPYDEAADSRSEIEAALAFAKGAKVAVLVVFGAN